MPVEAVTYISDLNPSNPLGTGEPKSFGDDHMRNIKLGLKNTFPNISGAATPSHAELNNLTGITGKTGTGNLVLSASPTFTGTAGFATVTATSGAGIAALNASNLASGTVPDARFPATLPALSGVNLTALNATNLASGTVADARHSANVPLLNAATNTFTGTVESSVGIRRYSAAGTDSSLQHLITGVANTVLGFNDTGSTNGFGVPAHSSYVGGLNAYPISFLSGGANVLSLSTTGAVTTNNTSANEVGYAGIPQIDKSVDYTCVLTDANKCIRQTGSSKTITIPANGSVAYGIGTTLSFMGDAVALTIAITTDTLRFAAGAGATGSRTLAAYGFATARKFSATEWLIAGTGLS